MANRRIKMVLIAMAIFSIPAWFGGVALIDTIKDSIEQDRIDRAARSEALDAQYQSILAKEQRLYADGFGLMIQVLEGDTGTIDDPEYDEHRAKMLRLVN